MLDNARCGREDNERADRMTPPEFGLLDLISCFQAEPCTFRLQLLQSSHRCLFFIDYMKKVPVLSFTYESLPCTFQLDEITSNWDLAAYCRAYRSNVAIENYPTG